MGSINDEIQRVLNPIYGDKSTNHLMRLFRTDHGLLEENLWHNFLQNLDYTGSINDQLYYLFSNFESIFNESTGLYIPATVGNYVSTPDHVDLDITGDLCIIINLNHQNISSTRGLVSKYTTTGNQRSFLLSGRIDNKLDFYISPDGTATRLYTSTAFQPFSIDEVGYLSITFDASNVDSNSETTFWSSVDGVTWTILGSPVTIAGSTAIFNSNADLIISGWNSGSQSTLNGIVYSAAIYDGIGDNSAPGLGTLVAEFDASAPVGPRYRDRTGKIWTINGSAWSWV